MSLHDSEKIRSMSFRCILANLTSRWAVACTITCVSPLTAIGAEVPQDLRTALRPFPTLSISIEGQTLRMVLNQQSVARATYEAVASAYCTPIAHSATRRPWNGQPLRGIEVVNVTRAQGFAFTGTVVDCVQWSKVPAAAAKRFLEQRTLICVGSECRPRRPGEIALGE